MDTDPAPVPPPDPATIAQLRTDMLDLGITVEQADDLIAQVLAARANTPAGEVQWH